MTIIFKDEPFTLEFTSYANGNNCIMMENEIDGNKRNATINLDGLKLTKEQVLIKDYHDNIGLAKALKEQNIIVNVGKQITVGLNKAVICILNDNVRID